MAGSSGIKATKAFVMIEGKLVGWTRVIREVDGGYRILGDRIRKIGKANDSLMARLVPTFARMGSLAVRLARNMADMGKGSGTYFKTGLGRSIQYVYGELQKFPGFLNRIQHAFRSLATNASMALAAIAGPTILAVKSYAEFDDTMRKVEARSVGTDRQMSNLRDQAEELGATTSYTAKDVGELQAKLAQKGFERSEIEKATSGILDLARAAGEMGDQDTTLAADAVATVIRSFKMEASDAGRVADVLTEAVNGSNLSLEGLKDSFAYIGPLANQAGMSLEETMAALGGLGNVAIEASMAGTAIRRMLLIISDAKERASFDQMMMGLTGMTVQMVDAAGELRPLPDILFDIDKATKNLSNAQKLDFMNDVFGVYGVSSATALSEMGDEYDKLLARLKNSTGAAAKTAQVMDAGLGGSFRQTASAIESVVIAIGKALDPTLVAMSSSIQIALLGLTEWIKVNPQLVQQFFIATVGVAGLTAAMFALGVGMAFLASVAALGVGILSSLVTIMGVLLSPVTIIAGGVLTMAYNLGLLNGVGSATTQIFNGLWAEMSAGAATALTVLETITNAIRRGDMATAATVMWAAVNYAWVYGTNMLKGVWDTFSTSMLGMVDNFIAAFWMMFSSSGSLWSNLSTGFSALYKMLLMVVTMGQGWLITAIRDGQILAHKVFTGFLSIISLGSQAVADERAAELQKLVDARNEGTKKQQEMLYYYAKSAEDELGKEQAETKKREEAAVQEQANFEASRNNELAARQQKRQDEINKAKNELDKVLTEAADKDKTANFLESGKELYKTGQFFYDAFNKPGASGRTSMFGVGGMGTTTSEPLKAITGAERGTIEAAKLFYESQQSVSSNPVVKATQANGKKLDAIVTNTANMALGDSSDA